ncbi:MAG: peptide chain release factor-like protein [Tepidisphaeraceae bacterium]
MPSLSDQLRIVRDQITLADDAALLAICRVDAFRGPGPGGQKRNKTSNGIRVTHVASGATGQAVESRSAEKNRQLALGRLRLSAALQIRCAYNERPIGLTTPKSSNFAHTIASVFDALEEHNYGLAETAERIGLTTSKLSTLLTSDDAVLSEVNRQRQARGHRTLRRSD